MNSNRLLRRASLAFSLLMLSVSIPGSAAAQTDAVTVSLNPSSPGATIPPDYLGLSFETADLLPNSSGGHYFINTNLPLLNLFSTLGIKSLRIGGNTADSGTMPSNADIDDAFGFAEAAQVKVLYTLRLKTFSTSSANTVATYVMSHYSSDLTCLAIGNEANLYPLSYATYKSEAQSYINTISASNPTAKFCGPAPAGGTESWTGTFATDFAGTGKIAYSTLHNYFGGNGGSTTGAAARDMLLSSSMLSKYASNANAFVSTVQTAGLGYRMEETNSFYNGGSSGASNTFAEALWNLDYLYWWANHGAQGLNFHTGDSVSGGTAYYSFFTTTTGGYTVHPGAYGAMAFSKGSQGQIVPVTLSNPSGMDLTAYGVLDVSNNLWVTIINKTHESGSITANLTLNLGGNYSSGNMWLMQAPNNDDSQTTGITFGGGEIGVNGLWSGTSQPVSVSGTAATLTLSPASAAVIQFTPSSQNCTAPSAPSGLTATAASSSEIDLSWTASSANCSVTYNVFGSTTSGFTPSTSNQIVSGLTGSTYSNTGLPASSTYYYVVEATNSGGSSAASNQANATTSATQSGGGGGTQLLAINAGGPAVSPFVADEDFSGGATVNHANTINTSKVTNPAPATVYQTGRDTSAVGPGTTFTYTIGGFTAGTNYLVRLHFAETYFTAGALRTFNVSINGTQVLTAFDIFLAAGGQNVANVQQFTEPADSNGQFTITFTSVTNNALVSGIEIDSLASCNMPTAPSGLGATATSSSQINLSWTASSSTCAVTYSVFRSTTNGFTPSSSNQIASGVSATTFSDTGLAASTTYYYVVEGTNSGGTSAVSNQASATTNAAPTSCASICINAGGPAASPFVADEDFSGGATINHANTINTSKVTNPAPAAVYQTGRDASAVGPGTSFTYTIGGFTPGSSHMVLLHFCETYWTASGKRTFNVSINGTQVLTTFDIFAAAGGQNIANIQQFTEAADSNGNYTLTFTSDTDKALVSGIEID